MRILCDMDGVVMDGMSSWLGMYNRDYNDSLKFDDIVSRSIEKYVKPECGKGIYKYLRVKGFYRQARPYPEAQEGIQKLLNTENDIWFVATPAPDAEYFMHETREWVEEYYPQIGPKKIIFCLDRGIINGHVLIDDVFENFNGFSGAKVLFERPWNQHITRARLSDINDPQCAKTGNWDDIIDIVKLLGVLL
jgi:5'-nucleotidase